MHGSHHAYAQRTLDRLTVNGQKPVFYQGQLFVLDDETLLWVPFEKDELVRLIGDLYDGKRNCEKRGDYVGIADQALSIAQDETFFQKAPVGTACAGTFYVVDDDRLVGELLQPHHRQRVMLNLEPLDVDTPLFQQFLRDTFRSDVPGEEEQQLRLVQEIAGAILLGVMPRYQKAVLFYDPYGRAGKGTLERILRQLVPPEFIAAVSPFKWDKEYYLASLVGARLNVVGELPDGETIPAANLKSVLGGDLIAGRQPTRPVVVFQNEAAHLFTSNHLIATRDHSEAFFSRWLLVEFPNSLLRSGLPLDPGLADRIIAKEMSGIAYWALQGGIRLLKQARFSGSSAHDRLMQKWRRSASSVDEFIHECCSLQEDAYERRSSFYVAYKTWCTENGRKPHSKSKLKERMEHQVGLPVRFTILDGIEIIRGISVHEDFKDRLTSL
jgi:P4 family phage/plasmid primase-like protien